jgi:uncharacterized protein YlxP (DUF503 family)
MVIGVLTIKIYLPWVHSLKEKRSVLKSIMSKTGKRFNISIAEIDHQDTLQTIAIGIAGIAANAALADSVLDKILNFIENNSDGELIDIRREIILINKLYHN